jgi:hypothetical protein
MNMRTDVQRSRLVELASTISGLENPLGSTMEDGCWGAFAETIARQHGSDACTYFGLTMQELTDSIRMNRELSPTVRNSTMIAATLAFASA